MGPITAVQPADSADHGEIRPATEPASRQCGRCRQFFPVEPSATPPPKWWACPPCHRTLFGTD